jgi:hypothetical protein
MLRLPVGFSGGAQRRPLQAVVGRPRISLLAVTQPFLSLAK